MAEVITMRCPVCDGHQFSLGTTVMDDRYGEPNHYRLAHCQACDHLATAPRLTEAELPGLYGRYYPRKDITSEDVRRQAADAAKPFARWIRWCKGTDNQGQYGVRPGESMLDVGCGSGVSLLEAAALGASAFGIEADPNVKPIASALGLRIHFGSLHDNPFPDRRFDLVVMNQVIEHLPDPDIALQRLADRLTHQGRLILVFPNTSSLWRHLFGIRWINWHIPYHLHHFDLAHFSRMATRCGLRVVRSRTVTPNLWTLLGLRTWRHSPSLGQPSPIWQVSRSLNSPGSAPNQASSLTARARVRTVLLGVLLTLSGVINRLVDALGWGDSLVVELRREGAS